MNVESVFAEVYPALYRYCYRLTGDTDTADDVAQEAFVRMVGHEVTGELAGVRVWLFKVATHLIRDRARVRDNRARLLQANQSVFEDPPRTPAEDLDQDERIARVRRALDRLGPRDRELLLLRHEGLAYKELAEAVGVAATSIGTLLARALKRLSDELTREQADDE